MTRYYLKTEIIINVPVEKVWEALVDFQKYDQWNQFIPRVEGELALGSVLKVKIKVPNEKVKNYKVSVQKIIKNEIFGWLGHFLIPNIIDGHHSFQLKVIDENSTLLIHEEYFKGLLVPFVWNSYLNTKLRSGFEILNLGLKKYLEKT